MGKDSLTCWPAEVLSHPDSAKAVPAPSLVPLGLALQQGGLEIPNAHLQPAAGPPLQNHVLLQQLGSCVPSEPIQVPLPLKRSWLPMLRAEGLWDGEGPGLAPLVLGKKQPQTLGESSSCEAPVTSRVPSIVGAHSSPEASPSRVLLGAPSSLPSLAPSSRKVPFPLAHPARPRAPPALRFMSGCTRAAGSSSPSCPVQVIGPSEHSFSSCPDTPQFLTLTDQSAASWSSVS